MVHLFARIAKLLSATSKLKTTIAEEPHPLGTRAGAIQEGSKGLGPAVNEESGTGTLDASGHALQEEARTLSRDIDCWITSLQLVNLEHERVQVGNRAYAHAMKVRLTPRLETAFSCTGRFLSCGWSFTILEAIQRCKMLRWRLCSTAPFRQQHLACRSSEYPP
jgi:hypothetical protein